MTKNGKRALWTLAVVWVLFVLLLVALSDGRATFFYRLARLCQWVARQMGEWGIAAENEYHRLMSLERMNQLLVKLALGTEVDIATGDELQQASAQVLDTLSKNKRPRAMYFTVTGALSFTAPLSGRRTVICGTVPIGRVWKVTSICVAGHDDNTLNTAGFAGFYIGDASNPMLSQLKVPRITSIPNGVLTFPDSYWATEGQSVFFVIQDLATITQFVGNVEVTEYRAEEILENTGR